jgi:drug/metabolite transporter (DMT)-like permease
MKADKLTNNRKSAYWMTGTLASFCLMAVGARELSGEISTPQLLFIRSLIGLTIMIAIVKIQDIKTQHIKNQGDPSPFSTRRLTLHLARNTSHFIGQYGWFLGITLLPLAEVFALEFTMPIWASLLALLFLNEKLTLKKVSVLAMGWIGVLVIIRPGLTLFNPAALIVLGAALFFAISHSTTKSLSKTEEPSTILFYMCLIQLPIGFVLAISDWIWPQNFQHWIWIAGVGITALSAHYCITKALQEAELSTVVTMDFLRLPLITLIGFFIYNESIDFAVIAGGALMLMANLANLSQARRLTAAVK